MRAVLTPSKSAEDSGPLPQFVIPLLDDEPDEMTIRRVFAPKTPPRISIETSDADATWKWEAPRADSKGRYAGVALPILEGERALRFDPSEVEVTRELASPFVMREVPHAMLLRTKRRMPKPRMWRRISARTGLIAVCAILAVALLAAISRTTHRTTTPIAMALRAAALIEVPALAMPPVSPAPSPGTGTIIPTVKGHRLYVDGKLVGDSAGPRTVECGPHAIKLGSAGLSKTIAVPCGGEISVSP